MSDSANLTTDAIPSPPRDELPEKEEVPKPKIFKKPEKAPTAFASVISVSNSKGVHIGSNYNVYVNSNKKSDSTPKEDCVVTDEIRQIFEKDAPVERKDIIFLSTHMNEDWKNTARLLDYSDGQISQFYVDNFHSGGLKEVIYQFLLDWIQNEADAATVGRLAKTLWNSNQDDAVKRWAKALQK